MIIVIGGIKGGSGKTTIATNLTVLRASEGKKVLLVDADEQRSAADWAEQRENVGFSTCQFSTIQLAGKHLYKQLDNMKDDYDDIIIDVGGRDTTSQRSALSIADVLITPFRPRSADIWTINSLKKMINEIKAINHKLECIAIINQADPTGSDNKDAYDFLSECIDLTAFSTYIGLRKAFSNAYADGLGISELKYADPKAKEEMIYLYNHVFKKSPIQQQIHTTMTPK